MPDLTGLFNLLIVVTVVLTALSLGLGSTMRAIQTAMRSRGVIAAVVVNVVAMPLIAYVVARFMPLQPQEEQAIILCAACAGGPLALKASQISRADLSWAFSLIVILILLNLVTLPLWSTALTSESLAVKAGPLFVVLVLPILLPVLAGVLIGSRLADPAPWIRWTALISNIGLVAAIVVGIVNYADTLAGLVFTWLIATALGVIVIGAVIGYLIGDQPERKQATSLVTLNRATSVALLAIGQRFPDNEVLVSGAIVFGLVQSVVVLGLATYWNRSRSPSRLMAGTETG